ncbi:MAG: hypothetical protein JSU59_03060, partial [Nitrospirota bacterium]
NDQLILQYLNNYVINYEQLQVASEQGRKLVDYVRQSDPNQGNNSNNSFGSNNKKESIDLG